MSDTSSLSSESSSDDDKMEAPTRRALTDIFIAGQLPELPFPANAPTKDLLELATILNLHHDTSAVKKTRTSRVRDTVIFMAHVGKSLISHAVTIMIVDIYPDRDTNCSSVMLRRLTRRETTQALSILYNLHTIPLLEAFPDPCGWELEALFHFAVSVIYYSHISGNGLSHGQAFDTIRRWLRGIYEPMAAELLPELEKIRDEGNRRRDDDYIDSFEEGWEDRGVDHKVQWQHFSTVATSSMAECILTCEGMVKRSLTSEGVTKLDAMREVAMAIQKEGYPSCDCW